MQRAWDRLNQTIREMEEKKDEALALAADQATKAQKHALEVLSLQKQKELELAIAQQVAARHAEINDLKKITLCCAEIHLCIPHFAKLRKNTIP